MKECEYYFGDLVYVDFDYQKIVGWIESHRIIKKGMILYRIDNCHIYVPPTMIHKLTEKQDREYREFVSKFMLAENNNRNDDEYIKQMQKAITCDEYIKQMQKAITWD